MRRLGNCYKMLCVVHNAMSANKYFLSRISLVKFYPSVLLKYVIKLINGFIIIAIVPKRVYFCLFFLSLDIIISSSCLD